MKIGIQGIKASFHDVAAHKFFLNEKIIPVECKTFKSLCTSLKSHESDYCMMAIENSIAGSILTNYTLLETFGFKIIGEVYLKIEMNLMALPGQTLRDIKIISSHPMALLQCQEFLTANSEMPEMKIIESDDTAESARFIFEKNLLHHGAIASEMAATTYNLEILKHGIETNKQNYTRFLVISCSENILPIPEANKSSLCFEVSHNPGSLAQVLEIFSKFDINITKIQSVPILGRPYQYSFHIDLEWKNRENLANAVQMLLPKVSRIVRFGEYLCGERPS